MPIPDFQTLMLPLLKLAEDRWEHSFKEAIPYLADEFELTTSNFTKGAIDYVTRIDSKIILIDGGRLTELMIEHNVGVTPICKYEVKKIDSDYFTE